MAGKYESQTLKGQYASSTASTYGYGATVFLGKPCTSLYYQFNVTNSTKVKLAPQVSLNGSQWVTLTASTRSSTAAGKIYKASTSATAPVFTHARINLEHATTGTAPAVSAWVVGT